MHSINPYLGKKKKNLTDIFYEQTNICFLSWNNTRNFKNYNLFTISYPYLSILYRGFSEKSIQVYIS